MKQVSLIEYGFRRPDGTEQWEPFRSLAEEVCRLNGYTLVARDVTPSRVVSIR